jgi:antirestriction protein ArdC
LVAEFGAAFLCHAAGIDASRLEQSAAYIAAWLRALRDDRRLAVVAAAQGQRAADHILGERREPDPSEEDEGETDSSGSRGDGSSGE